MENFFLIAIPVLSRFDYFYHFINNIILEIHLLFCALTEIQHGILQQRVFAIIYYRSSLVDAVLLDADVVIRLSPFLARAQSLVLQVLLMGLMVNSRHMVGHATDRYVILVLGGYVIGMIVQLDVIGMIRLRLNRLRDLRHVIFVMIDFVEWLLIDLQIKQFIVNIIATLVSDRLFRNKILNTKLSRLQ